MISNPCGLEVLVAPIVIVPAAATSGAVAMDATSGGKSRISEPKFNEWRKIARPGSQNALKTFQQPPLISKCTFYRHRMTLPKKPPATPLGLAGHRTVPAPTRQRRCVNPATLTPSLHSASCAGFGSTPSKKVRMSSRLTGQYSLASTPTS